MFNLITNFGIFYKSAYKLMVIKIEQRWGGFGEQGKELTYLSQIGAEHVSVVAYKGEI